MTTELHVRHEGGCPPASQGAGTVKLDRGGETRPGPFSRALLKQFIGATGHRPGKTVPHPSDARLISEYRSACYKVPIARVMGLVSQAFQVSPHEILSPRKNGYLLPARYAVYWLARHATVRSLPAIGRFLNRDHSTITHGVRRAEELMARHPEYKEKVIAMRDALDAERAA